ncbi:hypothetical protein AB3N58_14240 [Leptospira sp. WS60.C2]
MKVTFLPSFILFLFSVFPLVAESENWKTCFHSHCISFRLSSNWYLTNRRSNGITTKLDHFRTKPIKEESGREIIPALVIVFKESEPKQMLDPLLFHIESKKYTLISNIREYYQIQKLSESKEKDVYKFLGMVGTFKDKEDSIVQHYITATEGEFGFTILVTCFESVYPQIQKDIDLFLASLVYEKRKTPRIFVSVNDQYKKAKEIEKSAQARLQTKQVEEISIALDELNDACELGSPSACELFTNLMNIGQ